MDRKQFAQAIESTLLDAEATRDDIEQLCVEAVESGFRAVCVAPSRASLAIEFLQGTLVRTASVAGFPLGNQTTRTKVAEVSELVEMGVAEVDVVWNVGMFLEGRLSPVSLELGEIRRAAGEATLKVILETAHLNHKQLREAAAMALGAGANFLKTSTGYASKGAEVADIQILKQVAGSRCGIKASGGIKSFSQVLTLMGAGANRIGTSKASLIWSEAQTMLPR